jgi:hypothetical protein
MMLEKIFDPLIEKRTTCDSGSRRSRPTEKPRRGTAARGFVDEYEIHAALCQHERECLDDARRRAGDGHGCLGVFKT